MAKPKSTPRKAPNKTEPSKNSKSKLSDFKPQRDNINKGKPHALTALDQSIRRDGYSAPMVAAADGEIFAGSKRLERSADVFGLDVEPIIVESDGKRPIIHVRTDIPSAKDPRAKRLGYADNALAVMDWNPDGELLAALAKEDEVVAALVKQENESLKALTNLALPNFSPVGVDEQPRLDQKKPITCPQCGNVFSPE